MLMKLTPIGAIVGAMIASGQPGSERAQPAAIDRIDAEIVVEASRHDVWLAWTTDAGLESFFADNVHMDLRIGGPFEVLFNMEAPEGQRGSETCTVLSYLPEEMISFSWNAPPKFAHARGNHTWVVVRLEEVSLTSTRVRLTHLGFAERADEFPAHAEEWAQVREYFSAAWPKVLEWLEHRFEPEGELP